MKRFIIFALVGILVVSLFGVNSAWASDKGFQVNCEFENNEVILTWEAVDSAKYYYIFRGETESTISVVPLTDFPLEISEYTDVANFDSFCRFVYVVVAYDGSMLQIAKSDPVTISKGDCYDGIELKFIPVDTALYKNGESISMSGVLKIINGKAYIPYDAFPKAFGGAWTLKWGENETRKVIITDHRDYFVFTVDSNQMTINGEKRTIDKNDNRVTAKKIGEEYYLPLRFTAELFGVKDINFDPVEKTVTLRFDEETEQSDKYYKREVNLKSGSNLRIDGKRYDLTANLEYKSGTLIPIEILLSAFGFFVSWESEDKLVFYKWNYLDLTKPRKIAGYFLVEKDYLVMDDKQIQLSEKSKKYNGKLYCSVGGYYTLDPISYIDWSASGANFYMYVPEDTHILSHTPKPFNRKVSMWYTTDDWNTEHAGEIIIDGDCYKESHEIKIINERYMLPGKVIMDAFGGEFMKNSDEFIMNIKSYKSSEGVPSTRIVTVKPVDSSYTVNGETEILDIQPVIIDDELYLPVRFFSDAFGIVLNTYVVEDLLDTVILRLTIPDSAEIKLEMCE